MLSSEDNFDESAGRKAKAKYIAEKIGEVMGYFFWYLISLIRRGSLAQSFSQISQ